METPATLPWPAFRLAGSTLRRFRGSEFAQFVSTRVRLLERERQRLTPSSEPRLSRMQSVFALLGLSAMSWAFLLLVAMALYAVS
jgi:hypothetical protein